MAGSLHIFRRRIANGGEIYQVNYTVTGGTFAKGFDSPQELRNFLLELGLEPAAQESIWMALARSSNLTLDDVTITPQEASALGMTHADIDF